MIVKILYNHETHDFKIEGVSAATVGTLAHRLMEIDPSDLKTAAKTLIENEKVKIEPTKLVSIVKSLHKKDLLKRIKNSKTVLIFMQISYQLHNYMKIYFNFILTLTYVLHKLILTITLFT